MVNGRGDPQPDVARIELSSRNFVPRGPRPFVLPARMIDRYGSIRP
jgi:hypothetical protein